MQRLFANGNLCVDFYRSSPEVVSACLVVTFSERTFRALDSPGFGTEFLLRHGFDVVAVKNAADDWYAGLERSSLEAAIAPLLDGRRYARVCAYGSSMGAHAALRFSGAVHADAIVALSPIVRIDLPEDRRWAADLRPAGRAPSVSAQDIRGGSRIVVAYDPCSDDALHADLVCELAGRVAQVIPVRMPLAGHPVGHYLRQTGQVQEFALRAIGDGDLEEVARAARSKRHASHIYMYWLGEKLAQRGRLTQAIEVNAVALKLDHRHAETWRQRVRLLHRDGRQMDARAAAARALELDPLHASFRNFAALNALVPS